MCGARVEARLDLSQCKVSDGATIYNSNGELKCNKPLPVNAASLPEGSFSESCYGCSVSGDILECRACLDEAKEWRLTSLDVSNCQFTGNHQGKLVCEKEVEAVKEKHTAGLGKSVDSSNPGEDKQESIDTVTLQAPEQAGMESADLPEMDGMLQQPLKGGARHKGEL